MLKRVLGVAALLLATHAFMFLGTWITLTLWADVDLSWQQVAWVARRAGLHALPLALVFLAARRVRR